MAIRPDIETIPLFYQKYVAFVEDKELIEALHYANDVLQKVILSIPEEMGNYQYAPGKWTIKEVICHVNDAERIFTYRALRFARNDKTPLHGFEENDYAPEANAHSRSIVQLAEELMRLRSTTIDLFSSFSPQMLNRSGQANQSEISVSGLGFVIGGHAMHHVSILNERYLPK